LFVVVLLGEKDCLDVGQDTSLSDGDSRQELVQFFVVSDGQLKMSRYDSCFLVVSGSVASQLQDFGGQVLEDGSQVDWSSGADSVGVVSLAKETMNTSNRELKSSSERSGLGLGLGFTSFTTSRHDVDLIKSTRKSTKYRLPCV
jgi:hypothetical protein